ncbi:MAG: hypothetical protein U9R06_02710 [Patescibacteria group bacterium]|nr:hypothetical protein [Patescibacteria group bacterium]
MDNDFKQTVDLKNRYQRRDANAEHLNRRESQPADNRKGLLKKIKQAKRPVREFYGQSNNAKTIDEVFNEAEAVDYKKINQPIARENNKAIYKQVIIILSLALAGMIVYNLFFAGSVEPSPDAGADSKPVWYAVKLLDNEIYYGQISDIASDPIVVNNVYYDYDQLGKDENKKEESTNLRLVKRGKETHGPEGTMNIVRSQVIYMEPLKEDSKVLKAILNYEQ